MGSPRRTAGLSCRVFGQADRSDRQVQRLTKLGHTVKLIAPAYVKPFVKRQKNDAADAEAICEATQRPTMRFVAIKSANQQAAAVVFRTRDLLDRPQRAPRSPGRVRGDRC